MMKMSENKPVLNSRDIKKAAYRWQMLSCATLNYEILQGASFATAVSPALEKIFPDKEEYQEMLESQYLYYNTNPWAGNLIVGAVLALFDSQKAKAKAAVQDLKTSLMGPLAGVFDTIVFVLFPTIMGSLAGYMLMEGNPIMALVWSAMWVALFFLRARLVSLGYHKGMSLLSSLGSKLSVLTESASVLGLVVVGGLISGVVNVTCPLTFAFGEVSMEIQPLIDQVMPKMIPVIATFICYRLLTKHNMSMSKLILLVIVFSMVAAFFGILAA